MRNIRENRVQGAEMECVSCGRPNEVRTGSVVVGGSAQRAAGGSAASVLKSQ